MMSRMLVVVCVAFLAPLAIARPYEVPKSACETMSPAGPGHNNMEPQNSELPYQVTLSPTKIHGTDTVKVTLSHKEGGPASFAGFMMQARDHQNTAIGTFTPVGDNGSTITCTTEDDTASHNNPDPKTSVSYTWTPPADFKGTASFYVTVAETRLIFWVKQKIGEVTVV